MKDPIRLNKRTIKKIEILAARSAVGGEFDKALRVIAEKIDDTSEQIEEDLLLIESLLRYDYAKVAGYDLDRLKGDLESLAQGVEKLQEARLEFYFAPNSLPVSRPASSS